MKNKTRILITALVAIAAVILLLLGTIRQTGRGGISLSSGGGEYGSIAEAIEAARYRVETTGDEVVAVNYANQISGKVSAEGLVLESKAAGTNWRSEWHLQDVRFGDQRMTVGAGDLTADGSRVNVMHELVADNTSTGDPIVTSVDEWFNNTTGGLEHGFTLAKRPEGSDGPLRLTVAVGGDLTPKADGDGQNLSLYNGLGEAVLNYQKLLVSDAEGSLIAARISTQDDEVVFEVDDRSARYPLVIDPTFIAASRLTGGSGSGNCFGQSVAVSGNTVVVGAAREFGPSIFQGTAYVFVRGTGGTWTQQAKLVAADGATDDNFGSSVSISGDTVIIGSPGDAIGSNDSQGSAYIFTRNGTTWTPQAKLTASSGTENDRFGTSVAISGETVAIGANGASVGSNDNQGAAYVYIRNGGAWTFQQLLTAADGAADDNLGNSLSISGNNIVVGALDDDIASSTNQGSAYVFVRSGTVWSQQVKLGAPDGAPNDTFGYGVSIDATTNTVAIGSSRSDIAGKQDAGAVYVFTRFATTWSLQQKLIAGDGTALDQFGFSSSISGNTLLVGAINDTPDQALFQGSAYVFSRSGSSWTQRQKLLGYPGRFEDAFGVSVATDGVAAIVGAFAYNPLGSSNPGAAYVYRLGSREFDFDDDGNADISLYRPATGIWYLDRSAAGGFAFQLGNATDRIAPADYDGDSKTDIAVYRQSQGAWYIYNSTTSTVAVTTFGVSGDLPAPGDYDGDRKADIAIYRPTTGTWWISGSSVGLTVTPFGVAGDVPVTGDYDGDGRSDMAVYRPSNGVWYERRSSLGDFAIQFGSSTDKVAPADFDGDGKTDVGIYRPSQGSWYIVSSSSGTSSVTSFGNSTDTPAAADYDGDGRADIAIYRQSSGQWWLSRSLSGLIVEPYGLAGDQPVPHAFGN